MRRRAITSRRVDPSPHIRDEDPEIINAEVIARFLESQRRPRMATHVLFLAKAAREYEAQARELLAERPPVPPPPTMNYRRSQWD